MFEDVVALLVLLVGGSFQLHVLRLMLMFYGQLLDHLVKIISQLLLVPGLLLAAGKLLWLLHLPRDAVGEGRFRCMEVSTAPYVTEMDDLRGLAATQA